MNENNYYYLGKITRKFSFKGELIIYLDTDTPSDYYGLKKIFLKVDNSFIPYFISKISKYKNNSVRVKFEDVNNERQAIELINYEIFLPIEELPKLEGKKFYYHEVIGFKVIDVIHGEVGEITYLSLIHI